MLSDKGRHLLKEAQDLCLTQTPLLHNVIEQLPRLQNAHAASINRTHLAAHSRLYEPRCENILFGQD